MATVNRKDDGSIERLRGKALQRRRMRVWRNDPCCARCGCLTDYPYGFNLDHKVALVNGGPDTEENTQVLCVPCHEVKTNEDLGRRAGPTFDRAGRVVW